MTAQAQAQVPLARVRGLVFLAIPLHPAGRPGTDRAAHLEEVSIPMLFIQGTHDELADLGLLRPVIERPGDRATLHLLEDADHSFHGPARTGRKDSDLREETLSAHRPRDQCGSTTVALPLARESAQCISAARPPAVPPRTNSNRGSSARNTKPNILKSSR